MSSSRAFFRNRRRLLGGMGAAAAAFALPSWSHAATTPTEAARKYSRKVIELVEKSLVIDMLAPLKLDFRPEAYAQPLTSAEAAMFRSSGITGFHNSVGVGGASAYDDSLSFLAAWS